MCVYVGGGGGGGKSRPNGGLDLDQGPLLLICKDGHAD